MLCAALAVARRARALVGEAAAHLVRRTRQPVDVNGDASKDAGELLPRGGRALLLLRILLAELLVLELHVAPEVAAMVH